MVVTKNKESRVITFKNGKVVDITNGSKNEVVIDIKKKLEVVSSNEDKELKMDKADNKIIKPKATKSCSTCSRGDQPISQFRGINGKETRTCKSCRKVKLRTNSNTNCVIKNDQKLSDHIFEIKMMYPMCFNCYKDFKGDGSDVYIYPITGIIKPFNRIRSIEARELELENYEALCSKCHREALNGKQTETIKEKTKENEVYHKRIPELNHKKKSSHLKKEKDSYKVLNQMEFCL